MRQIFLRFFAYSARKTKIDSPASVPISLGKTAVSYDKKNTLACIVGVGVMLAVGACLVAGRVTAIKRVSR